MAHVGVPRRDPCQKCQLPVFLAERLTVGKKVYHRTCLKCARCGSQLTPGSFYETEVDDEYCCETCPDEEEIASNEMATATSSVMLRHNTNTEEQAVAAAGAIHIKPTTVRSSIADRLAFFEQSKNGSVFEDAQSSKLLQKSVSDEEKSKSLKRMEATVTTPTTTTTPSTSAYKMNTALSSFLNDTIDGAGNEEDENSEATAADSNKTDTQMETSGTDDDDETEDDPSLEHKQPIISTSPTPPELPTTQPPMPAVEMRNFDDIVAVNSPTANRRRFTATAQLQLVTAEEAQNEEDETKLKSEAANQQLATKDEPEDTILKSDRRMKTEIQFDVMTTTAITSNDNANNNNHQQHETIKIEAIQTPTTTATHSNKLTQIRSLEEINLDLSQINDHNTCFTKDKIADTDTTAATQAQNTSTASATIIEGKHIEEIKTELRKLESESSTDMDVDPELEQETEPKPKPKPTVELRAKPAAEHLVADEATTERLSVVRARLQQFEVIANKDNNNTKSPEYNDNNVSSSNIDSLNESEKNVDNTNQATVVNANLLEPENVEPESMLQQNLINEETKLNDMEIDYETESKKLNKSLNEVPANVTIKETIELNETIDNSNIEIKPEIVLEKVIETNEQKVEGKEEEKNVADKPQIPMKSPQKQVEAAAVAPAIASSEYPEDLNPFASDEEEEEAENKENIQQGVAPQPRTNISAKSTSVADTSLNPFDSSDDEIELEKSHNSTAASTPSSTSAIGLGGKVPPPRPPPPRISRNPFADAADTDEDVNSFSRRSSLSSSLSKKTPVPTPRSNVSLSQNPTPEPTPRLSNKTAQSSQQQPLQNSSDYYGSANSLGTTTPNNNSGTPQSLHRNSDIRGSNNSLTSSAGGTIRSRKNRKAPAPPAPVKELFPSTETIGSSKASTPSSSTVGTPKSGRKKRPAPAPPKPARLDPNLLPQLTLEEQLENGKTTASKNSLSYPLQSELDSKLSDEEKALLEGKQLQQQMMMSSLNVSSGRRRLIPLDASLLEDNDLDVEHRGGTCTSDDVKQQQQHQYQHHDGSGAGGDGEEYEPNVVYRRMLIPPKLDTPTHESNPLLDELNAAAQHDRQLEKLKDNKEAQNRNRQSQVSAASSSNEDGDPSAALYNKSSHGKWKRRKGPAPALPIPQRKILQMLPLQEIRHELEIIEVQQQGLEKQGVILEKMIRDRCEGENGELLGVTKTVSSGVSEDVSDSGKTAMMPETVQNSKEVEDLILQLFELVNEKNELFRRQAELMYLRRQHRLEQEQADLEYEIRVLMAQPERNKTDTDKAREEALIARLVDVVQLRNEVVDCLEMDRLREAEEDMSIKQRLEMHTSKREGGGDEDTKKTSAKLSKKEKKKQKEAKKLSKSKKIDADKDADETELNMDKQKLKKKKKKFLF